MTASRVLSLANLLLAAALLGDQLAGLGAWAGLPILAFLCLSFAWGSSREIVQLFTLLGLIGAAGYCAILASSPLPAFLTVIAALTAWDLAGFVRRAGTPDPQRARLAARLEHRHLLKLLLVDLAGLALGLAAFGLRLRLGFFWVVLVALAGVLGLALLVQSYRPREDRSR
ncbi:MAG TPA: hypothetical protein VMT46_00055 [Anaerolineaceae bacterium]|nr:hypothetical protein [Anaerolineaceae bacterium]